MNELERVEQSDRGSFTSYQFEAQYAAEAAHLRLRHVMRLVTCQTGIEDLLDTSVALEMLRDRKSG